MKYVHKFVIQACHFNDQDEYTAWDTAVDLFERNEDSASRDYFEGMKLLMRCLRGTHGHNFKIFPSLTAP